LWERENNRGYRHLWGKEKRNQRGKLISARGPGGFSVPPAQPHYGRKQSSLEGKGDALAGKTTTSTDIKGKPDGLLKSGGASTVAAW